MFFVRSSLTVHDCQFFSPRFDSEGKETSLASVGAGLTPNARSGPKSMYSDRVFLSHIVRNPSLGQEKVYFSFHS